MLNNVRSIVPILVSAALITIPINATCGPRHSLATKKTRGIDTFIPTDLHDFLPRPDQATSLNNRKATIVYQLTDIAPPLSPPPLQLTATGRILEYFRTVSQAPAPVFKDGTLPEHDIVTGSEIAKFGEAYEQTSPIGNSIIAPHGGTGAAAH
ncbi:hypothetical protein JK208_11855 [Gluconobacter sp. Dm-74]|uniref:hypothetical protein n=1 Tax=Gluconobacter sp. Dm-74 TaxID=2799803 RepID=UPI001B8D0625|nr:hypothetical protein [Gluconobacter sp. Dm-74]MBS1092306.1 hypothetical protein [Gluconobacter sp. Dm-74]